MVLIPRDPAVPSERKCLGYNLLWFGGLGTFSDNVWIPRETNIIQFFRIATDPCCLAHALEICDFLWTPQWQGIAAERLQRLAPFRRWMDGCFWMPSIDIPVCIYIYNLICILQIYIYIYYVFAVSYAVIYHGLKYGWINQSMAIDKNR